MGREEENDPEDFLVGLRGGVSRGCLASSMLWMKWQRGPYGQKPVEW